MPGKPTAPSTLSGHAKDIWQSAFQSAYEGTCAKRKDRDACAASIAWSAVKNKYRKGKDGAWVAKAADNIMSEAPHSDITAEYPTPLEGSMGFEMGQVYQEAYHTALNGECKTAPDPEGCAREKAMWAVEEANMTAKTGEAIKEDMDADGMGMSGGRIERGHKPMTNYDPHTIAVRRLEREIEAKHDAEMLEAGKGDAPAMRPAQVPSEIWRSLPPEMRTVAAMLKVRANERAYQEASDLALEEGWERLSNPGVPEEYIFRRFVDTPDGAILVRAVLVRSVNGGDWYLRELSRGASASLTARAAPGEVRYRPFAQGPAPDFSILRGGPGSGHHGHEGRPGKRGGSQPSDMADIENVEYMGWTLARMRAEAPDAAEIDYIDYLRVGAKMQEIAKRLGVKPDSYDVWREMRDQHEDLLTKATEAAYRIQKSADDKIFNDYNASLEAPLSITESEAEYERARAKTIEQYGKHYLESQQGQYFVSVPPYPTVRTGSSVGTGKYSGDRGIVGRPKKTYSVWVNTIDDHVAVMGSKKKWPNTPDGRREALIYAKSRLAAQFKKGNVFTDDTIIERGGPGSGHFGHAGRPGERGGSEPTYAPGTAPSDTYEGDVGVDKELLAADEADFKPAQKRPKGKLVMTDEFARAAAKDAANANMKKAGRTAWSEEDYEIATETYNRLMGEGETVEGPDDWSPAEPADDLHSGAKTGKRGHLLLTKELEKQLPPLYANEDKGKDAQALVKFFSPMSNWTWYASEYDPESRTFFGLVDGFEKEFGYFSLDELEEAVGPLGMAGIERDLYWEPQTFAQILGEAEDRDDLEKMMRVGDVYGEEEDASEYEDFHEAESQAGMTPRKASKAVADKLAELGATFTKTSGKTVGFSDLARDSAVFVKVEGLRMTPEQRETFDEWAKANHILLG